MFFVRAVVAQYQVKDVFSVIVAADGGDGVVLFVRAADDVRLFVRPIRPGVQHALCHIVNAFAVGALDAHHGVVPIENTYLHIGVLHALISLAVIPCHHRQYFRAALIVVVCENGAAYDGQSGIGTDKVVGEQIHKVQKAPESRFRYRHGAMFAGKRYHVFGIILVRGILQFPWFSVEFNRNGAQGLACGVVQIARKAHVFGAEHTGGVPRLGQ